MAVRFAKGAGPLAGLVRQQQDLIALRRSETRRLEIAAGNADAKASEGARSDLAAVDKNLNGIDVQLASEFRDYAALAHPKPLTLAATQAILGADEALVLFLDVSSPRLGKLPEETLIWVVTKEGVRWHSIPLGTRALADQVAALRCGLDASNWDDARTWRQETATEKQRVLEQQARRARCTELLGLEVSSSDRPPFDLGSAYELYQVLFAPFSDLISDKRLIIVPSGPLSNLPFQVLVTKPPEAGLVGMASYRQAAWLGLQQPAGFAHVAPIPGAGALHWLWQSIARGARKGRQGRAEQTDLRRKRATARRSAGRGPCARCARWCDLARLRPRRIALAGTAA